MTRATRPTGPPPSRRWHDLDALRGFAMLLGIGLHAALSFYPSAWPVQDLTASADGPFDEFVLAVHGFRMPLFFMLSGFFTALLWRRRGLGALLGHRLRRVAIPFVLAVLLIVPTVDWVVDRGVESQLVDSGDVAAAAYLGYEGAVTTLLEAGADVDAPGADGFPPLYLATAAADAGMVDLLLEQGADPNVVTSDGMAVDAAAYFGFADIGEALVAAGSRDPRPPGGSWQDIEYWGLGAAEAPVTDGESVISQLPNLHHLWFLWFLILFVLCFAPIAWLADRLARRRDPAAGPARWPGWLMWMLVPLVVLPQLNMRSGETIPAFGPDTSLGWLPDAVVFVYYLLFFGFGILLYGRTSPSGQPRVDTLGRRWWLILPAALVVLLVALEVTFGDSRQQTLAAILQVTYAWLMIIGLLGLFRALLSVEHRSVRYLSDSSYWMYLVHLTIVFALQGLVRTLDLPAGVKFAFTVATTFALLLLSYQLFVRYTSIGILLNGRRRRPGRSTKSPAAPETVGT